MELITFFAGCVPIPALMLIGCQSLYWVSRLSGRGNELPLSDQYAIDDLFNAMMMIALSAFALMARSLSGMGLFAAFTVSSVFVGVRVSRKRGLSGWVVVIAALTWAAVSYRLNHGSGPICIRLINNVG